MQIDDALITYLEDLSRLDLPAAEKAAVKESLGEILAYMDKLGELDTAETEALSHPFPAVNCLREDEAKASWDRARILENAPAQKDGYFKVPKTVE